MGSCSSRIALLDVNGDGVFDSQDSKHGTNLAIDQNGDGFGGPDKWHRTSELLKICGASLEIKSIQPNGSAITFRETPIARAEVGQPIPEFSVVDIRGAAIRSSELRGNVTVIDFWASWCAPCVVSLSKLEQLFGNRSGVKLIEWNTDDSDRRELVQKIIESKQLTSPQIVRGLGDSDPVWRTLGSIGGGSLTIPLYLVINSQGTITGVYRGLDEVQGHVERLLEAASSLN